MANARSRVLNGPSGVAVALHIFKRFMTTSMTNGMAPVGQSKESVDARCPSPGIDSPR